MDEPPLTTGTVAAAGRAPAVTIERQPAHGRGARWVVARAEEELTARYGFLGDTELGLAPAMFDPPRGAFLVARAPARPEPVGGVGIRRIGTGAADGAEDCDEHTDAVGEVKRLWVDPTWRGLGVARALMAALEDAARELGLLDLDLGTGDRQPEAVALYSTTGWVRRHEDAAGRALPPWFIRFTKRLD